MKKIVLLLCASLFAVSCSKDNVPTAASTDELVLLHQTITTFTDITAIPEIENYSYNGNHIARIIDGFGDHQDYTYVGDLIDKIDFYQSGLLTQTDYFHYNSNNLLSSFVRHIPQPLPLTGIGEKEVYVYNSDGTISFKHYTGDLIAQTNQTYVGSIEFNNDEISILTTFTSAVPTVRHYLYDGRKSAMKNATGYKRISFYTHTAKGVKENIVSQIINSVDPTSTTLTNFTYNSAFYPLTSTKTVDGEAQDGVTQYIY